MRTVESVPPYIEGCSERGGCGLLTYPGLNQGFLLYLLCDRSTLVSGSVYFRLNGRVRSLILLKNPAGMGPATRDTR
jgi:hypothetical protein